MKRNVNTEIALTHILSRKKQTLVASLGVMVGITAFVFLNSLMLGFNRFFDGNVFKSMPHMRIFKDDRVSTPLIAAVDDHTTVLVSPRILNEPKKLINPSLIISAVRTHPEVTIAAPWVTVNLFYTVGKSQLAGVASGADIFDADAMFAIRPTLLAGDLRTLRSVPNGALIGSGVAGKLNLRVDDNVTVISSFGVKKLLRVCGIFQTGNSITDKTRCYINLSLAQQLLGEGTGYVTDIYVNVRQPHGVERYAEGVSRLSGYNVETWKEANQTFVAAGKTRSVMMRAISGAILLVAAFGIYNILNMTIMQKLDDIAILKATGFSGKDVVRIFVGEALVMGTIGTAAGLAIAAVLVNMMGRVYIGGDIGYFPIRFEPMVFVAGALIGLVVTCGAGFFPARNAAKVDPVEIFRK